MTTANNNTGNSGNWITVPVNTTANPTVITVPNNAILSGGNIIFTIGTGGGGGGVCAPDPEIELALPVEKKKKESAGCKCKKCKEFFEFAEPNQEDGTLVCWACRHGY